MFGGREEETSSGVMQDSGRGKGSEGRRLDVERREGRWHNVTEEVIREREAPMWYWESLERRGGDGGGQE